MFGGSSPVVACFKHSMMVCMGERKREGGSKGCVCGEREEGEGGSLELL